MMLSNQQQSLFTLFRYKRRGTSKTKINYRRRSNGNKITFCTICISAQQPKQQSFRVGWCLFKSKERNEGNTIIIKTKLHVIRKARNENGMEILHCKITFRKVKKKNDITCTCRYDYKANFS